MSMSWAGKIKSAFEGMVDATDARAQLAAGVSLASLRQQVEDRQLEAQIENIDEPWRVPFVLAPVAGPLWLADALVNLAQSLSDAEESDHPDRPTVMTSLTHGQILVLLAPLEALASEIAALLADPRRRPSVRLPMLARPYSPTGAGLMTEYVPLPYVRGLLNGTVGIVGAVQLLVVNDTNFLGHPQAPGWVSRAFSAANGDLAAIQTRLDAVQNRSAPVLSQRPPDTAALRDLALSLWDLANTALDLGQRLAAPTLLDGAQPLPPRKNAIAPSTTTATLAAATPPESQQSPAAPLQTPDASPPGIPVVRLDPVADRPVDPPHPAPRTRPPAQAADPIAPMPQISLAPQPDTSTPRRPATPADQPRPLPQIGGSNSVPPAKQSAASMPTPTAAPRHAPAQAPRQRIDRQDRWLLGNQQARHRLRAAGQEDQAERDLAAFWEARDWSISALERQYLDEVRVLATTGAVTPSGRSQANAPFAAIYRVLGSAVRLLDRTLQPGSLFSYDYQAGGEDCLWISRSRPVFQIILDAR